MSDYISKLVACSALVNAEAFEPIVVLRVRQDVRVGTSTWQETNKSNAFITWFSNQCGKNCAQPEDGLSCNQLGTALFLQDWNSLYSKSYVHRYLWKELRLLCCRIDPVVSFWSRGMDVWCSSIVFAIVWNAGDLFESTSLLVPSMSALMEKGPVVGQRLARVPTLMV